MLIATDAFISTCTCKGMARVGGIPDMEFANRASPGREPSAIIARNRHCHWPLLTIEGELC